MKKYLLLFFAVYCVLLLTSCGKQCEQCDCWKGGQIIDNYKHCSGDLFSPKNDHQFYRNYMIETYGLDSVSCK